MQAITKIQSRTTVLPTRDIDTDQIIPARFLTTTSREGLGAYLFHDLRFDADGKARPDFALNQAAAVGCEVLVGGNNFGCGSSREHAPVSAEALANAGIGRCLIRISVGLEGAEDLVADVLEALEAARHATTLTPVAAIGALA